MFSDWNTDGWYEYHIYDDSVITIASGSTWIEKDFPQA